MEYSQIDAWSNAVDQAEQFPLMSNLPETASPGFFFEESAPDGTIRRWQRVYIVGGATGGRWAYWKAWTIEGKPGLGPHPHFHAIADSIFNGDVPHFIGMLGAPYLKGSPGPAWVLVSPRMNPPHPVNIPEEKSHIRYEKSNEVFDVETQESKDIR